MRSPLKPGKYCRFNAFRNFFFEKNYGTSRAAEGFVSCGGNNVCIRKWRGVKACGYEPCDMCDISHMPGTYCVCNVSDFLKIQFSWIGGCSRNNKFWPHFLRKTRQISVVNASGFWI